MPRQYVYHKRAFLNPLSSGYMSYIHVQAESSDNGEYKAGNYIVTIADCSRVINLDFFLGTKRYRRQSLAKIDLMIDMLTEFREALRAEAKKMESANKREDSPIDRRPLPGRIQHDRR